MKKYLHIVLILAFVVAYIAPDVMPCLRLGGCSAIDAVANSSMVADE